MSVTEAPKDLGGNRVDLKGATTPHPVAFERYSRSPFVLVGITEKNVLLTPCILVSRMLGDKEPYHVVPDRVAGCARGCPKGHALRHGQPVLAWRKPRLAAEVPLLGGHHASRRKPPRPTEAHRAGGGRNFRPSPPVPTDSPYVGGSRPLQCFWRRSA